MKLLVIGGVAAGAFCAARTPRLCEAAEIAVVERGFDVSFANCGLPYHVGGEMPTREVLAVDTPISLKGLLKLDGRTHALRSERESKRVEVRNAVSGTSEWFSYYKVMRSPGASTLRLPIFGIDDARIFAPRSLDDIKRIVAATEVEPLIRESRIHARHTRRCKVTIDSLSHRPSR